MARGSEEKVIYIEPAPLGLDRKVYLKTVYENRKKAGVCVYCGKRPARPGRVTCGECKAHQSESRAMHFDACPEAREEHNQKSRIRSKERRERLQGQGLCDWCGKRPAEPGKTKCKVCAAKMRLAKHNSNLKHGKLKQYRERGLCLHCGAEREPGKMYCPECMEKKRKVLEKARAVQKEKKEREKSESESA